MPSFVILAGVLILLAAVAAVWLLRVRARGGSMRVGGHHEDEQLPFLVVPPGLAARAAQAPAPAPPAAGSKPAATGPAPAGARPPAVSAPDAGPDAGPAAVAGSRQGASPAAVPEQGEARPAPAVRPPAAGASKAAPRKPAAAVPTRPRGASSGGAAPATARPPAAPPAVPSTRPAPRAATDPAPPGPAAAGEVDDGTLQLLPGRLEVLSGGNGTREIRFVRIPGRDPEVTIGRGRGEPHRHVRLDVPTVSRVHVALHFADGRWSIENRSDTNPAVVRGAPLGAGERLTLSDGDLVELGEVVMRFRS